MHWFLIALLPPIFLGFSNILDKYLLDNHFKNPISYTVLLFLLNWIYLIILFLFFPISTVKVLEAVVLGFGFLIAVYFYSKALLIEESSRVVSLTYLSSIFVLVLAAVFLGELLTLSNYFGALLIVISAVLVSYKKEKVRKFSPALVFALLYGLIFAVYSVVIKYLLDFTNYWTLLFWGFTGGMLGSLLFLTNPRVRSDLFKTIKKLSITAWVLTIFTTLFAFISILIYTYVISIQRVSLVSAIFAIRPFFVLFFAVFLTLVAPRIMKEEIDRKMIVLKLIAVFLVIVGSYLIV